MMHQRYSINVPLNSALSFTSTAGGIIGGILQTRPVRRLRGPQLAGLLGARPGPDGPSRASLSHVYPLSFSPFERRPADDHPHQDPGRDRKNASRRPPRGRSARLHYAACQTRNHHGRARHPMPRLHGESAENGARAAELCATRLPALPQVDLHLDQPPGMPRHSRGQAAETWRHRQHRHHRDQGRLPRRHQPHVLCWRADDPGAPPV